MQTHENRWISVSSTDGLFPTERTVRFQTVEGEVAVFVSSNQVDNGRLRVLLLDEDETFALVQVPSHGGMTTAKVRKAELSKHLNDSLER